MAKTIFWRTLRPAVSVVVGALGPGPMASAEVYRCLHDGVPTFTDVACTVDAQPEAIREPTTIKSGGNADLARRHDERLKRERGEHEKADARWLGEHAASKAEDERLRAAVRDGQVIKGMDAAQVRQLWGEPAELQRSEKGERWIYRDGKKRRTVSFKADRVSAVSGAPLK